MTPKEIVLAAIHHEPTDVIPYILSIDPDVRGRLNEHYGGAENFPRSEAFIVSAGVDWRGKATPQPGGRFRDIFGVVWEQGNIFHIVEPRLKKPSLKGFTFPELIPDDRIPALRDLCKNNKDKLTNFSFGLLFWERSWALRGMDNMLMDMIDHPAFVEELLDGLMNMIMEAMDKVLPLPFDGIRFGDDFGAQKGLIMGVPYWRKYFKPRLAKMYAKAREAGKIVSIHSCGDNSEILGELIDMGVQVFNPAQPEANDLPLLKKEYGKNI